jgi:transposase
MVAANATCAVIFSLSPGHAGDAPEGRKLLSTWGKTTEHCYVIMDRAYEGNETQALVKSLGHSPVVPPNPNRLKPWNYDHEMYKKRNEIERLFRRLKGFRRLATRFDKLDIVFIAFIHLALIFEALR